jgi:uncharacterized protein YciI
LWLDTGRFGQHLACLFVHNPAMTEPGYPHGDALIPERRDEHTIIFLVRPPDAPDFTEGELDRLQVEHLTHLRDLARRGLLIANGPLVDQTNAAFRGISIYRVPLAEAVALANADPMVRAGRLAIEGARWWTAEGDVAFGRPASNG